MLATRIDRYVFRQLLVALIAVTGGLVALIWLTQSLRFVEMVVNHGLSLLVFLQLTGLLVPSFVAVILPITTFVVVQFIYQRLAGDRELTVMRGAGLSNLALARPALTVAVLALAAGYALNVWIVPASFRAFREYQFEIRNRLAAFLLEEGVFTNVSDNLTVYVRTREPDGTLRGILVDEIARDPHAQATILAERGRLLAGSGPPRVLLQNGSREEIDRRTGRLNVLTFAENTIDLADSGHGDEHRTRDNTELSIHELLHPGSDVSALDRAKFLVEAHRRLSAPITTLSYALVALVAVLMGGFRRYGNMLRQFVAIIAVVLLLAAGLVVANLAARSPALVPLIWVHAILPGLLCAIALFAPDRLVLFPHSGTGAGLSMGFAATLSVYIGRQFLGAVIGMLAALSGLVALFDFIELLRRSANRPDATFGIVVTIASLRLPWEAMEILPFAVLLGGMLAFWRLTRSSELVVARAAGISAWQFLTSPVSLALALGVLATAAISPLSSVMMARAEALDNSYLRAGGGPLALAGGQLWLRQSDRLLVPQGVAILHAQRVTLQKKTLQAEQLSVFRLDPQDRLLERIEAVSATLGDHVWHLEAARVIRPDQLPEPAREIELVTDLTVQRVQESFASPDTLSVWALPGFIHLLERSGFSAIRHRLRFQSLLALPLLAGTMSLVSAGFSMRPARRGGVAKMIGSGVAAGFALFVISKVAEEFGNSGALPAGLAAWAPAAAGLMLALALLLHLEDG